ncbi:hypothetical protein ADUPG1_012580 [Aduncisulcus paluster]|uniref:Uncharacterized protein n=1 Tax=Aduncisulcus paluster TaxID=2918883 RepID=A0ABQ5JZW7_9EUKA|nr:hypothetical protein ADUPG1_012580 [Aduncisulcus paluster]
MSSINFSSASMGGSYAGFVAQLSEVGKSPLAEELLDKNDPAGHYLKLIHSRESISQDMTQLIIDDNTFPLVKGVLFVSIHSCKRLLTDPLFPGVLSCYTEVLVQGMTFKSTIVPIVAANCVVNASFHIPTIINRNVRHPANIFSISVFVVPSAVLSYHKPYLLGTVSFHMFDVISSKKANAMFSIFSGDQTTGEVDLSLSWTYGVFGYGHSAFLRDPRHQEEEYTKHSLYPRISVKEDRKGGFRIPSCAPILTPQPSFLCAEPVPFTASKQFVKQGILSCGEGFDDFQSERFGMPRSFGGSGRSDDSISSGKEASVMIGDTRITQGAMHALKAYMGDSKFASHPLVKGIPRASGQDESSSSPLSAENHLLHPSHPTSTQGHPLRSAMVSMSPSYINPSPSFHSHASSDLSGHSSHSGHPSHPNPATATATVAATATASLDAHNGGAFPSHPTTTPGGVMLSTSSVSSDVSIISLDEDGVGVDEEEESLMTDSSITGEGVVISAPTDHGTVRDTGKGTAGVNDGSSARRQDRSTRSSARDSGRKATGGGDEQQVPSIGLDATSRSPVDGPVLMSPTEAADWGRKESFEDGSARTDQPVFVPALNLSTHTEMLTLSPSSKPLNSAGSSHVRSSSTESGTHTVQAIPMPSSSDTAPFRPKNSSMPYAGLDSHLSEPPSAGMSLPLIEDSSIRFKRLSSELERLPLMRRKYQMIDGRRSKLKFLEKIIGLNSNNLQQTSLRSHAGNPQFSHDARGFMKYMVPLSSLAGTQGE